MKIKLFKTLRLCILLGIFILVSGSCLMLYRSIKYPAQEQKTITHFTYNNKEDINYEVVLKPNSFFDSIYMEQDKLYITSLVKDVNTAFSYEYKGASEAQISGSYEIIADIEGFVEVEKDHKTVWEKRYVLVPMKKFDGKGISYQINERVPITVDQYNQFVKNLMDETKISSKAELRVLMNIELNAVTPYGVVNQRRSPSITIPLGTSIFSVLKSAKTDDGRIEEVTTVMVPLDKTGLIINIACIVVFILAFVFMLVFTTNSKEKGIIEKETNKIIKQYGSRLVSVSSTNIHNYRTYFQVQNFEDLIKISDEINKPVMFIYSADSKEINEFFIIDNGCKYFFTLIIILDHDKETTTEWAVIKTT